MMIGQRVIKWIRLFKEVRIDIHDEKMSGKPSIVLEKLVQLVEKKVCNDHRMTRDVLEENFLHCEVVTEILCCRKSRTRRVPKMLISEHRQNRVFKFCKFLKPYERKDETITIHL